MDYTRIALASLGATVAYFAYGFALFAAILYARIHPAGGGVLSGLPLGALIGLFLVCMFVIHNYVNLRIGLRLTLYQGIAYLIQWLIVGAAIGLIS